MTPKEKAEELVLKYSILKDVHNHLVKQFALILVNEVLELDDFGVYGKVYWQEVRKEINKL